MRVKRDGIVTTDTGEIIGKVQKPTTGPGWIAFGLAWVEYGDNLGYLGHHVLRRDAVAVVAEEWADTHPQNGD